MTAPAGRLVLAGASGFIGGHVARFAAAQGWTVRTIGRAPGADARWDDPAGLRAVLEASDAVLNLAGRSVSCRYTKRTADEIFSSRTETTAALGRAIAACDAPPPVWLNSSTGTIYRDARDRPQTEAAGQLGSGFSVAVARAWERELFDAAVDVRRIALRTSIVLGPDGGALAPIVNLARMGFGGREGDGAQVFSWIHVDDFTRAVLHLIADDRVSGAVNVATEHPVSNAELMAQVRRAFGTPLGRGGGVPLPAWALRAGARIIRTEAELVLKSRWVEPEVLAASGFAWRFPRLPAALDDLAARTRRGLLPVQLG